MKPLVVPIHCNHEHPAPKNWNPHGGPMHKEANGASLAQLVAGRYFCVSCKRQVRNVVW